MLNEAKHLSSNPPRVRGRRWVSEFDAPVFRAVLLRWYRRNGRALPWRKTRDPYAILVSEFMLQQTQVATVLPYYERWLWRFPNFESVARASQDEILHAWQGLGYYSRARNLHSSAKDITNKYRGRLPRSVEKIATLPGAGRYTANAIASFAFNRAVPAVDANIARVLARLFNLRKPIDTTLGRESLWEKAALLLPKRGSRDHNSALMDLGALVCVARNPKCEICPVREFCCAIDAHLLPVKRMAPRIVRITEYHSFTRSRRRVLLEQSQKRWRGMWMLPRLPVSPKNQTPLHLSEFPFTHHQVTLAVFAQPSPLTDPSYRWFAIETLDSVALPSPHRRALEQLLSTESQKLCSDFSESLTSKHLRRRERLPHVETIP